MPKIPAKKAKGNVETGPMDIKDVADQLQYVSTLLTQARKELDMLWETLYTRGFTSGGPITEDENDVPF